MLLGGTGSEFIHNNAMYDRLLQVIHSIYHFNT